MVSSQALQITDMGWQLTDRAICSTGCEAAVSGIYYSNSEGSPSRVNFSMFLLPPSTSVLAIARVSRRTNIGVNETHSADRETVFPEENWTTVS